VPQLLGQLSKGSPIEVKQAALQQVSCMTIAVHLIFPDKLVAFEDLCDCPRKPAKYVEAVHGTDIARCYGVVD
jgi:hypothetical protein